MIRILPYFPYDTRIEETPTKNRAYDLYAVLVSLVPLCACAPIFITLGLSPIGGDTFYHIKYAQSIISAGKVISNNPYFPSDPIAYPLGSHIIIANMSILSGIPVTPLVSTTPVIFGILIALGFYAFAGKYVTRRYAFLATVLFYGASIIPVPEVAVNTATISNSLAYPYTSVLLGLFLFFISFQLQVPPIQSPIQSVLAGIMLGELTMTFHLLALGAILVIIAYTALTRSRKTAKDTIVVLGSGAAVSSFYWTHILSAGLPSETAAFGTYVQLTGSQYFQTIGPSISTLLLAGVAILLIWRKLGWLRKFSQKYLLLVTLAIVFLLGSTAWRVGLVLVNDLFLFFDIGPLALLTTLVVAVAVDQIASRGQKILGTVIISILILSGFAIPLVSVSSSLAGPNADIEKPYLGVIDWFNAHASSSVFASDISGQFIIASESSMLPVAIPSVISDYYVPDLNARTAALQAIIEGTANASAIAIRHYSVAYVVTAGSQPYGSITGTSLLTPVYPVQPCFKGTGTSYDFEANGVPQVFDLYNANTTNYYLLSNPELSSSLSLSYLFNPRTSGPVDVYVNGTLVLKLTGGVRGVWQNDTSQIPSWLVGRVEDVRISNLDPLNQWYLDSISIGPEFQCTFPTGPFQRETIFLVNSTSTLNLRPEASPDRPLNATSSADLIGKLTLGNNPAHNRIGSNGQILRGFLIAFLNPTPAIPSGDRPLFKRPENV